MRMQIPKSTIMLATASFTNGESATASIDTSGFSWGVIDLITTAVDAATHKPSVLRISEGGDGTNYSDVASLVGGGASGFTIPNWQTSGSSIFRFAIDLRSRARYLKLSVTPSTTQSIEMIGHLLDADVSPYDSTTANVLGLVRG